MTLIKLVEKQQPTADEAIVASIEKLLEEAKAGYFHGGVIVMLKDDLFAVRKLGIFSNLEMVGALAFASHAVMGMNDPTVEQVK